MANPPFWKEMGIITEVVSLIQTLAITQAFNPVWFFLLFFFNPLIILLRFLCSVAAYLIGGIAYNMYSGARGLELIPNYEVWKNFPSDVMGGVGFVFGIITCQKNSKSEEYDNI